MEAMLTSGCSMLYSHLASSQYLLQNKQLSENPAVRYIIMLLLFATKWHQFISCHHFNQLSSPFSTDSKPSMDKLAELGVLSQVSSKWWHLGLLFGQSTSDLDNFKSKAMLDNKECCERVFDKWINDDGSLHYPLSWEGLFKVLCKIGHGRTAIDIEKKL